MHVSLFFCNTYILRSVCPPPLNQGWKILVNLEILGEIKLAGPHRLSKCISNSKKIFCKLIKPVPPQRFQAVRERSVLDEMGEP